MRTYKSRFIIFSLIFLLLLSPTSLYAQAEGGDPAVEDPEATDTAATDPIGNLFNSGVQPPMENIFFNVLWGSVTGALLVTGVGFLDDSIVETERYSFSKMTENFGKGATYGGFAGLGIGIFLSYANISLDPNRSRLAIEETQKNYNRALALKDKRDQSPDPIYIPVVLYTF